MFNISATQAWAVWNLKSHFTLNNWLTDCKIKFLLRNLHFSKFFRDHNLAQKNLCVYVLTFPAPGPGAVCCQALWDYSSALSDTSGSESQWELDTRRGGGQLMPAGMLICMHLGAGPDGALWQLCSAGQCLHNWWNMIIMQAGVGVVGWSIIQGAMPRWAQQPWQREREREE